MILMLSASVLLSLGAKTDFAADSHAARTLVKEGRFEEAIKMLCAMAEKEEVPENRDECLKKASGIAFTNLKDYARAMELAGKMKDPIRSKLCKLNLMVTSRKAKEAIEQFKDENIDEWPANCRLDGFAARGEAYFLLKDAGKAEKDFSKAIQCTEGSQVSRGRSCQMLGFVYRDIMKDDDKALDAFNKGMAASKSNFAWRNECFLGMINILLKQGRVADAAKAFEDVDFSKIPGDHWKSSFCLAHAEVLRLQGKNGQASARLCEVLQLDSCSEEQKKQVQKKLDAIISGDASEPGQKPAKTMP